MLISLCCILYMIWDCKQALNECTCLRFSWGVKRSDANGLKCTLYLVLHIFICWCAHWQQLKCLGHLQIALCIKRPIILKYKNKTLEINIEHSYQVRNAFSIIKTHTLNSHYLNYSCTMLLHWNTLWNSIPYLKEIPMLIV